MRSITTTDLKHPKRPANCTSCQLMWEPRRKGIDRSSRCKSRHDCTGDARVYTEKCSCLIFCIVSETAQMESWIFISWIPQISYCIVTEVTIAGPRVTAKNSSLKCYCVCESVLHLLLNNMYNMLDWSYDLVLFNTWLWWRSAEVFISVLNERGADSPCSYSNLQE